MQKFNYTPSNPFSGSVSSLAIGAGMVVVPLVYPFGIRIGRPGRRFGGKSCRFPKLRIFLHIPANLPVHLQNGHQDSPHARQQQQRRG